MCLCVNRGWGCNMYLFRYVCICGYACLCAKVRRKSSFFSHRKSCNLREGSAMPLNFKKNSNDSVTKYVPKRDVLVVKKQNIYLFFVARR